MVGHLTMSQQCRWPANGDTISELEHKLGECMWWLVVLAERMDIDISEVFEQFLTKAEKNLEN